MVKQIALTSMFLITLFLLTVNAQSNYKQKNDSIFELYLKKQDSIANEKRIKFLKVLPDIPADTTGEFSIAGLNMTEMPDLRKFEQISSLVASNNKLKSVDMREVITDSVKRLYLAGNELKRIKFAKNSGIEVLDLSQNNFKRIPRSIRKLKNLRYLVISNNNIKRIPRFFKIWTA